MDFFKWKKEFNRLQLAARRAVQAANDAQANGKGGADVARLRAGARAAEDALTQHQLARPR